MEKKKERVLQRISKFEKMNNLTTFDIVVGATIILMAIAAITHSAVDAIKSNKRHKEFMKELRKMSEEIDKLIDND